MTKKRHGISVSSLSLFAFLSGCASAVNGSQEKILIYSNPEGAKCRLYQGGELKETLTTPRRVVLQRSSEQDLILNCVKAGYQLSAQSWDPDLSSNYVGNEAWWLASVASLSVFIPGSGLFAGGAAYDQAHQNAYGYPRYIAVDFKPLEKGMPPAILPEHFKKPD